MFFFNKIIHKLPVKNESYIIILSETLNFQQNNFNAISRILLALYNRDLYLQPSFLQ